MKTVNVRLLLPDDVDERYLTEQLVAATSGSGAPRGAALLDEREGSHGDDCADDLVPIHVSVRDETQWWHGEELNTSLVVDREPPALRRQVERVQALARELYG